jgi:protein RecA
MPPKKKEISTAVSSGPQLDNSEDFSAELIKQLNREAGDKIAFNLGDDDAPTNVRRWIPTGSKLLDYAISNRRGGGFPEGRIIEIQGPPSCHARGDRVMMYDGSIKTVETVVVGDMLMGPDSRPRTVLKLVRGQDMLYRLTPGMHAASHHVSSKHLLPLVKTKRSHQGPERVEIAVDDYLNQPSWFKDSYSLERREVEFSEQFVRKITIPPYILGLLLGDGCLQQKRVSLTTADEPIMEAYTQFCNSVGYEVTKRTSKNKAVELYHRNGTNTGKPIDGENDLDQIRKALRSLGLLGTKSGTKFIPHDYKIRSKQDRLALIAGLLDTDGHYSSEKNNYEYTSKSFELARDFVWVARTVGLKVSEPTPKIVDGTTYFRVHLSGSVPCLLTRKQSIHNNVRQNVATHGFLLEPVGEDNIYGFTVDIDNLYLMEDTTVQRNCGKSHLAFEAARATQAMGGVVVYIDTENATSPENLKDLGINVHKNFVFIQTNCTEEVLKYAEMAIMKSRSMNKDVPMTIIWDSVAACSPKAELEGQYEDNSIGLQARVLSKGMRKISNVIANQKVLFLLINQQRMKIGVMYGDPTTTPGGSAIPYATSVRLRVMSPTPIKAEKERIIGVTVEVKVIKNKVAKPFRSAELSIIFGKGIVDDEQVFDVLRAHCDAKGAVKAGGKRLLIEGSGGWKTFQVADDTTGEILHEVKFYKAEFREKVLSVPEFQGYIGDLLEAAMVMKNDENDHPSFKGADANSLEEMRRQENVE